MIKVVFPIRPREKFKQYLDVKPFKIVIDYMVLETIHIVDLPSGRKA